MTDHTKEIEAIVKSEGKASFKHLLKLWIFVFSATKVISSIYLGLFIVLSFLRPVVALIWKEYIATAQILRSDTIGVAILLLVSYWGINFISNLIESYMAVNGDGDLEQLDAVQINRQQELMHTKLLKKINSILYEYFEIPKMNDKIEQVFEFMGNPATGVNREVMLKGYILIAKLVSLLSITISLWFFNPWLCFILLIVPIPVLWTTSIYEKLRFKFKINNSEARRKIEYYQKLMLSPANKEMKVLGLYDFFYEKWKCAADEYTAQQKSFINKQTFLELINTLILNVANITGIIFTIILMLKGKISLGETAAVILLIETLVNDTILFLTSLTAFIGKKQEACQFDELMSIPVEKKNEVKIDSFRNLKVENLKYRYPFTERYVLDGLNLEIQKGEKVAFVGENGGGKTTFIKLIEGLLCPSSGSITINGISQEKISCVNRYEKQSTVSQEPVRYTSFTVRENVFLGDTLKPMNEEKIDDALKFAGLSEIEKNMLLGKDMGGTDLSGGQWQKLAIARASYRGKDFIILDEPTSNLDPIAETEVFQKYISLSKDKTVIFVTHRISVAALANRIIVFKNGKIIEDGTHEELILKDSEYKRLYSQQSKWYNV